MAKFIGVKMIEAVPMTAEEAIKNHYIVSAFSSEKDGYEVTYNVRNMLLKKLKTKFGLVLDLFFNGLLMV